jgi:methionyl-tRNA formyltransferase
LSQAKITIEKGISSFNLFLNLCIIGQKILVEAFDKLENGTLGIEQDLSIFTYYSHPTSSAYLNLKRKGFSLFNLKDFNVIKTYIKHLDFNQAD